MKFVEIVEITLRDAQESVQYTDVSFFVRIIYLPGYNQSPSGNFALISILPYRKWKLLVINLADIIGGKILNDVALRVHSAGILLVHLR